MSGHAGWQSWRSFSSDSSVTKRKLASGTLRRIVRFAIGRALTGISAF